MNACRKKTPLQVEQLEGRWVPTVDVMLDPAGNMTITGIPDGPIDVILSPGFTYDITDNFVPVGTFIAPGNITLNFPNSTADDIITIDLGGFSMGKDLMINSGAGDDLISTIFSGGTIPGNVTITQGNSIFLDTVFIGGNVQINSGSENVPGTYDLFDVTVGGDLRITSGNEVDVISLSSLTSIGGDALFNIGEGGTGAGIIIDDLSFIGRNLTVLGGSDDELITLDGTVGGNAFFNLGGAFFSNDLILDGTIAGSLSLISGIADDNITIGLADAATIGGNVFFNLGDGRNVATFGGSMNPVTIGGIVSYNGGVGTDELTLSSDVLFNRNRVFAQLSLGNDTFTLASGNLGFLYVDFGFGSDMFDNMLTGPFTFRAILRNLP